MYQISLSIMLVADQTVLSPDQMFCTHPVAISKNWIWTLSLRRQGPVNTQRSLFVGALSVTSSISLGAQKSATIYDDIES